MQLDKLTLTRGQV